MVEFKCTDIFIIGYNWSEWLPAYWGRERIGRVDHSWRWMILQSRTLNILSLLINANYETPAAVCKYIWKRFRQSPISPVSGQDLVENLRKCSVFLSSWVCPCSPVPFDDSQRYFATEIFFLWNEENLPECLDSTVCVHSIILFIQSFKVV